LEKAKVLKRRLVACEKGKRGTTGQIRRDGLATLKENPREKNTKSEKPLHLGISNQGGANSTEGNAQLTLVSKPDTRGWLGGGGKKRAERKRR